MILRKPYAFFIKHFKLMHLLLAFLTFYSVYKTKLLLDFFNEYSSIIIDISGQNLVTPLLPFLFQMSSLFIIILLSIILIVMIIKKKPFLFYIIAITTYIYNFVVIQISKSTLNILYDSMIEARTILLVRDLILISFIVQIFCSIVILIRGSGFDIKKFDFKSDLKQIEINEKDNEEVEVDINFDSNKLIRIIRNKIRYFRYSYIENKVIFNSIFASLGAVFLILIIMLLIPKAKIKQNEFFIANDFSVSIGDSYLVNTDYKGNLLDKENYYLIVKLNIKSLYEEHEIDPATTNILIQNYVYTPIFENLSSFFDFGNVYNGEQIGKEYEEKVLVYKIPKEIINNKITFSFVDKTSMNKNKMLKSTKIDIDYTNLIGVESDEKINLTEVLDLKDSIMSDYKIKINAFDIQKKYKLSYNFCIQNNCIDSYEYIVPSINSNYDKVLLKINGTLEYERNIEGITDLYDFIEKFGKLYYVIDGQKKQQNISFKEVKSKKVNSNNTYYVEVLEEVINASNISIKFTIRNKNYEYILK